MKQRRYAVPYLVWMAMFIVVPLLIVLYYGPVSYTHLVRIRGNAGRYSTKIEGLLFYA